MSRANSIIVCMWDDVTTAEASEHGEYERTGDEMREIEYNCTFDDMLRAADQFVWWVNQHVGRHERPSLDIKARFDYVNGVVYCDDGDEDYVSGETAYRRVSINVPTEWTDRQRAALNAAIERAFSRE